jgi:hypothetical protein
MNLTGWLRRLALLQVLYLHGCMMGVNIPFYVKTNNLSTIAPVDYGPLATLLM